MNHAEQRINNHFNEVKRKVQLETEQSIAHINQENERLIKEIDECERRCLLQLEIDFILSKQTNQASSSFIVKSIIPCTKLNTPLTKLKKLNNWCKL